MLANPAKAGIARQCALQHRRGIDEHAVAERPDVGGNGVGVRAAGLADGVSVLDSRTFVYYYRSSADGRLMLGKGGNTFARGGRIAPSPALMRQSLHARAVQLPPTGGEYAEFADDTDHALVSGCEGAALALIERSLQQAQALLGRMPGLVLHGGGASSLRERLPAHAWQPDAVLRGLARWHALRIA